MAFSGIIAEIPLGMDGLNGSPNELTILPTELIVAENLTYENGYINKCGGAARYTENAVPGGGSILAGYDFFPTNLVQRQVIYTDAGYMLKDIGDGTFAVTLATGLLTEVIPVFVEGGQEAISSERKLFCFTGAQPVKVLTGDGSTVTNLALPTADWASNPPRCGVVHEGRLWAASGSRVYYSTQGNHEDFSTLTGTDVAGQMAVFPGVGGGDIQSMYSFKGLIVVTKPRAIFVIDTSQPNSALWKVFQQGDAIGTPGPRCMCQIDDDLLWISASGSVHTLQGVTLNNVSGINITQTHQMNPFIKEHINLNYIYKATAIYYAHKREVHIAVPQTNSTICNARLVIDLNKVNMPTPINPSQTAPRFSWSPRDVCISMWLRRDFFGIERPVIGTNSGLIYLLDQDTRSKDGAGFYAAAQTGHLDFSYLDARIGGGAKLGATQKIAYQLEIAAQPMENVTLYCDVYIDGRNSQTLTFNLTPVGTELGAFVLGTSKLGATDLLAVRRKRVTGSGRRWSFKFYNSALADSFAIGKAYFYFKVGNESIRS